jgi:hypothetical protein
MTSLAQMLPTGIPPQLQEWTPLQHLDIYSGDQKLRPA